ncbi:hypothetical protein DEJ46_34680 [Streptomyces venezuelae]|uniref:Uncharacterized protein n=1 Tax=Streptomyces venezuelae TaxID=54571 RepID=A0A5P2B1K3_STRVZ|nr:hypothetical protein DEJ46_34680 [Streptomyces venezuelae]
MTHALAATTRVLSVECRLGQRQGYEDVHAWCRQTEDVPLPHSDGSILLARKCQCSCHHH